MHYRIGKPTAWLDSLQHPTQHNQYTGCLKLPVFSITISNTVFWIFKILTCVYQTTLKPHLHWNANRTRMRTRHAKMMRTFDVDVFLRRGKQHSAVQSTFGEQPNAILQMSVLQKKFAYDTFICTRHFFFFYIRQWQVSNADNSFALTNEQPGNRVYSLPRRMPNSVQIYLHKHTHRLSMPHSHSHSVHVPM